MQIDALPCTRAGVRQPLTEAAVRPAGLNVSNWPGLSPVTVSYAAARTERQLSAGQMELAAGSARPEAGGRAITIDGAKQTFSAQQLLFFNEDV